LKSPEREIARRFASNAIEQTAARTKCLDMSALKMTSCGGKEL
jgi:hypothetical protein